jgi:hypothetical protein
VHGFGDLHGIGHYLEKIVSPSVLCRGPCFDSGRMFNQGSSQVQSVPNNLAMNGARDTVLQLEVHLRNSVFWEYGSVRDITCEIKVSECNAREHQLHMRNSIATSLHAYVRAFQSPHMRSAG